MSVRLVWAQDSGGVIGADGDLPWDLPEDRRLFRALTTGSTVVMGRRTWESLPPRFRPLPGRRNVVLSRTVDRVADGVPVVGADDVLAEPGDVWVIGGGEVYAAFLPHAADAVVTELDLQVSGDTFAPVLGDGWAPAARVPDGGWLTSASGLRYRVSWWRRDVPSDGGDIADRLARWQAAVGGAQES